MGRHSLPTLNLDTPATHAGQPAHWATDQKHWKTPTGRAQGPYALIWHTTPLSARHDTAP